MSTQKFSKSEAIQFGWNTMKKNISFLADLLILVGLIYFIPTLITGLLEDVAPILSTVISILSWGLFRVIEMGLIKIALMFCDGEEPKLSHLFSCFPLFLNYLLGLILYGLIVLGGIILLIVPGIIWGIKFQFFDYFIVDKKCGPIEALKRSSAITKDTKWNLFSFDLLLFLINLFGALCLLVGLFATVPTTLIAMAFVYRKLLNQAEESKVLEIPEVS